MGSSASKLVSEKEEGLGCKENLDEGGGGGEMRMEVMMDHDLEVLTAASNKFNALAQCGIKVDGDFGPGLATVRKHMEGFKRRYLDGERKLEKLEGENAELKDQVSELKRRLEEKDGALGKMREDHLLEMNQRVTKMEPRREAQIQAGCSRNLTVPNGDENLRAVQGGDVVTEKDVRVVRLIDRKREYWESSGSSSDSDEESTDSDDDMQWSSLRSEVPSAEPLPATLPTFNEGDVDEVLEEEEQLARADRTPSNGDPGEELVGPHDVRRSRCRGGSEGQRVVALELEESGEVGNSPVCVANSRIREEAAVTVSSQVRTSVRLRARSSQGLIVAKQSKFADFEVESPSKGGKHQNGASSHRVLGNRDPQPEQKQNFLCPTCTKAFSQKSSLNRHMRSRHSNSRPFQCPKCPARFKRKDDMRTHMLIHSDRRPFKCQVCGANFKQKAGLTNHLRIHTRERSYSCQICGKSFTQSGHLKTHMEKHEGDEERVNQVSSMA